MRKNKKNAFTLIELLAVIVILAIIALIATPIILGIVEDARRDSFLRSVELIIKATDIDVFGKNYTDTYTYIIRDGNISNLEIGVKNTDGMNGSITYDINGNEEYAIHNGKYCVRKYEGISKAELKDYVEGMCVIPTSINNVLTGISFEYEPVTYDGTVKTVIVNGLPQGLTVEYPNGNQFTNAGTYIVKAIIKGNEVYSGNKELETTFTINKAPLIIKADNKFSNVGENIVELTYTVEGTIYGTDDLGIEFTPINETEVGTYDIEIDAYNDNYDIILVNGVYTIIGYPNGQRVYFDVDKGTGCTMEEYASSYDAIVGDFQNSLTGYNGLNGSNGQNSCLLFYAFNSDGGEYVDLILDHNTTSTTYWTDAYTNKNTDGPVDVLSELKKATASWKGTITPSDYIVSQTGYGNYTIDYDNTYDALDYKARLITAQEIAQITGADQKEGLMFNEKTTNYDNWFYLDSLSKNASSTCTSGNTTGCQYGWLYDRISNICENYGCYNNADSEMNGTGYWTGTSTYGYSGGAWYVGSAGKMDYYLPHDGRSYGVRPVIRTLKSNVFPGEAPFISGEGSE